ncbi:TVP38/TMEM64 family protein [Halalkalibacillus halophilus]|uniref:TVP38/TMEM64 family protein n=1 Tax=Halalkalibacillus halophilus TaxID=392827 RepID=UPI00042244F4|nr:TVP38/TMEM64 family protein [Halalkalibacillus halophilus]
MNRKTIISITLVILFVILLYSFNQRLLVFSPEDIRSFIYAAGWLAPLFYLLLFTLRPLILFPASVFSIVAGLAFGAYFGTVLALSGATFGAILAFMLSRKFGTNAIKLKEKGKLGYFRRQFEEKGFRYILLLRFLPIVNFDLISYAAGLSKVKLSDYVKATVLGILPGTLLYNFLGASIVEGDRVTVILVVTAYVLVIAVPVIWNTNIMKTIDKIKRAD